MSAVRHLSTFIVLKVGYSGKFNTMTLNALSPFVARWSTLMVLTMLFLVLLLLGFHSICLMFHDDVIKWKHFPRYWPFVREIHMSPVNSPHKGQWRGTLMCSLICAWINAWINNREAGDLRRYDAHYDVTAMFPNRFSRTRVYKTINVAALTLCVLAVPWNTFLYIICLFHMLPRHVGSYIVTRFVLYDTVWGCCYQKQVSGQGWKITSHSLLWDVIPDALIHMNVPRKMMGPKKVQQMRVHILWNESHQSILKNKGISHFNAAIIQFII